MLCLRFAAALLLATYAIAPALATEDRPATADQNAQPPATGNPAKPSQTTPPYPRDGTDLKTQIREQQDYMVWMYENTANQDLVVIQLRPGIEGRPRQLISSDRARAIGSAARIDLKPQSLVGLRDTQLFQIPMKVTEKALAEQICIDLKKHPDVVSCDPGGSVYAFGIPTDALYASQWSFQTGPGGANIHRAWDTTTGAATTVVAILDSGISSHEDLSVARILPGYDFVSDPIVANDGGGRDADPSDTGNWVTEADRNGSGSLRNCKVQDSDWHGTHVAGIIGATANNGNGLAGVDWAAKLLPVRVLGKCGNRASAVPDLADAILWATGVDIGTAPVNPNPAKVINMSLSGPGVCPSTIQRAIDEATRRGAVVIAAAGNDSVAGSFWPATCQNVLTVVATDAVGEKAPFSNWGSGVGVSAPGTNILSTVNPGTTVPVAGSAYRAYSGTSMAAAHVSGIASLMLAANPDLTPFEVRQIIQASSRPFARGSAIILGDCGTGSCGAGIVNGAEAVRLSTATRGRASLYEGRRYTPNWMAAALPTGEVAGWGASASGQLGSVTPAYQPRTVPGLSDIVRVFAGVGTLWAVRSNGEAYALGEGTYRDPEQALGPFSLFGGDPLAAASTTPVRTPALDNAVHVSMADAGKCFVGSYRCPMVYALTSTGSVLAWGYDLYGSLGLGNPVPTSEMPTIVQRPTVVAGLPAIKRLTVGTIPGTAVALDQSGNTWAWGWGEIDAPTGRCNLFGNGASDYAISPVQIPGLSGLADVAYDSYGLVALRQDGTVFEWNCWNWSVDKPTLAVDVPLDRVVAVGAVGSLGFAIRSDGSVWKWYVGRPSSLVQIRSGGALRFESPGLVLLADGTLFDVQYNTISNSTTWATSFAKFFNGGTGRLNVANSVLNDDTDLQASILSSISAMAVGESFDYLVSASNLGSGAASNALVTVALPSEVSVQSVPAGCTIAGQVVSCPLGDVAAGQGRTFSIKVTAVAAGDLTAAAYTTSDSYDYAQSDNTAGVDVSVQAAVDQGDGDVPTLPEWGAIALGLGLLFAGERARHRRGTSGVAGA